MKENLIVVAYERLNASNMVDKPIFLSKNLRYNWIFFGKWQI